MNSDIRFYLSIFMRRLPLFAAVAGSISAAAIVVSLQLPAQYQSSALLLVESPQIPTNLAASTVQTDAGEQLEIMEQRLLTRANLLDIADEFDVFAGRGTIFPDQIVREMRQRTQFNARSGRNRATLFTISFESENPETAAAVVNSYVTRVLDDNVELRTARAGDTMEFFEQEVARLGADLERQSARILEFKNRNINALPENLNFRLQRLSSIRERVVQIDQEIDGLGQQRERLILVFNATGNVSEGLAQQSPEQQELAALQDELADALSVYSEQNPRVRLLKARVDALEARVADAATASETNPATAASESTVAPATVLDIQLLEIDSRVERLEEQRERLVEETQQLQTSIDATPANAVALEALERQYANLQSQYDGALRRQAAAETGERIETLSKGERISVLNQPVVSREPTSPNRPKIAAAGTGAGIMLASALVVLLELLNRSIRRPVDITRGLGIVPLATLPMIRTPGETIRRRSLIALLFLALVVGVPAILYYIHVAIMPLDLAIDRIMARFGL